MKIRRLSRDTLLFTGAATFVFVSGLFFLIWRPTHPQPVRPAVAEIEQAAPVVQPVHEGPHFTAFDASPEKDYLAMMVRNWAKKDPLAAADYTVRFLDYPIDAQNPIADIVAAFAKQDLAKARDFVDQIAGNKHYDIAMGGYLSVLATKRPNEAMSIVTMSLIAESNDAHVANALVVVNAAWETNQDNIESWVATLPSSKAREDATDAIQYLKMNAPDLTLRAEK